MAGSAAAAAAASVTASQKWMAIGLAGLSRLLRLRLGRLLRLARHRIIARV
jgi:hypothetical protein